MLRSSRPPQPYQKARSGIFLDVSTPPATGLACAPAGFKVLNELLHLRRLFRQSPLCSADKVCRPVECSQLLGEIRVSNMDLPTVDAYVRDDDGFARSPARVSSL